MEFHQAPDADAARNLDHHFHDFGNVPIKDIHRKGGWRRMRDRWYRMLHDHDTQDAKNEKAAGLVRDVMETTGGNNEALANKIHGRFLAAGVAQPSVEIRFEDVCASAYLPVAGGPGLMTVGKDLKMKGLGAYHALTCKRPEMRKHQVLKHATGMLRPGRMSLVLGPPASGKSSLMKALCGRLPMHTTGSVSYNGYRLPEFNVTRTARYVDQYDLHNPQLTVRETLMFSAMCQGPGFHKSMLTVLERKEEEQGIKPDQALARMMTALYEDTDPNCNVALTLQMLSLVNCADTIVGNNLIRGVSGGEKKRVTTGEIIVGPSKVLFMDEISTGLDSASTLTIVQSLSNWAKATQSTIVISLLQPEPKAFAVFDDVMLVANGRMLYLGPQDCVEKHFASLGFVVPEFKDVADFLQELASQKDQPQLRAHPERFEPQLSFVHPAALHAAFCRSAAFQHVAKELAVPFDRRLCHQASLMRAGLGMPGWDCLKALMWRESLQLGRDSSAQVNRIARIMLLVAVASTLFMRGFVTTKDDVQEASRRMGVLFFSIMFMQFLGIGETADTIARLPLFFKQVGNQFFPRWAYTVPVAIVRIPWTVTEVTLWTLIMYWSVGFENEASRFFQFWATLVLLQLYGASLFRLTGTLLRSMTVAMSGAVMLALVTVGTSGFALVRAEIPPWWQWMFWVSPLQYTLTGLANNEYLGDGYVALEGDSTVGRQVLRQFTVMEGNDWRWIGPVVLIAWFVGLNLANMAAAMFMQPAKPRPKRPPPADEDYVLDEATRGPWAAAGEEVDVDVEGAVAGVADKGVPEKGVPDKVGDGVSGEEGEGQEPEDPLLEGDNGKKNAPQAPAARASTASGLPFTPVTLTFTDLNYFVPDPRSRGQELQLLHGILGSFRPGVLTALMGASGAGKTTLMDVLADRKTAGRQEGRVLVNGFPKARDTFARVMGYCEQFDIHHSGATVEEAVRFSAELRLADVTEDEREMSVHQTMEMVELDSIAGAIVGMPGVFGLSGEQFKRLTIAVELVSNPSIIFMDEPTSGLDARAAQIVMRVVRNIVDNQRTVACTIHQPSADIFYKFDELLLLKRGGWQIFYGELGPRSSKLVAYFEGIPGVANLDDGDNPAAYMLTASSLGEEERLRVNFADLWKSKQGEVMRRWVESLGEPDPSATKITFSSQFARGFWTQYHALITRYLRSYWRNPAFNTTRILLSSVCAFLIGSFYWGSGTVGPGAPFTAVLSVAGTLYMSVLFAGIINYQSLLPMFYAERPVMYRERAAGFFSVWPWAEAMLNVEVPWVVVQSAFFSVIAYFMIQFELSAAKFFFYYLVLFSACLTLGYMAMVVVAITPSVTMAMTFGATLLGLWSLFAGFMIPREQMPVWWRWMNYLTPSAWHIYALVADQLGDKDDVIIPVPTTDGVVEMSIPEYLREQYGFRYEFRWAALGISWAFVLAFRLIVAAATRFLNFQKR